MLQRKCRVNLFQLTSTKTQNDCMLPCTDSSHGKSGVMVSIIFNVFLVMGWTWALSSTRGSK